MAPFLFFKENATSLLHAVASNLHPTRTLPHLLQNRQTQSDPVTTITVISTTDETTENSDPDDAKTLTGGAIAGIVIGSIVALLLLAWIIRSCTNLGAPPGDEAVPGRPWYGGVKDEYPPRHRRGRSRGRSRSRSRHNHHSHSRHSTHYHPGHSYSRSRSRRVSVVGGAVPVQEVAPAPVVVRDSRRDYYDYGAGPVRGGSRSRSRGRY